MESEARNLNWRDLLFIRNVCVCVCELKVEANLLQVKLVLEQKFERNYICSVLTFVFFCSLFQSTLQYIMIEYRAALEWNCHRNKLCWLYTNHNDNSIVNYIFRWMLWTEKQPKSNIWGFFVRVRVCVCLSVKKKVPFLDRQRMVKTNKPPRNIAETHNAFFYMDVYTQECVTLRVSQKQ